MGYNNITSPPEFILVAFSDLPHLESFLIFAFILMYLLTIFGNLLIIILIQFEQNLHKPMYFLLSNLSVVDITYTSVTVPKTLANYFTGDKSISFPGCFIQLYFFVSFASTEFLLLTAMAYDRYVAICNPLRYPMVMSRSVCFLLSGASWIVGFIDSIFSLFVSLFDFCKSNAINHFSCDLRALLTLSCSNTDNIERVIFAECLLIGMSSFMLTLISYVYILNTILKIKSTEGRKKAFSTCTSHITAVTLFYGTMISIYVRPASVSSLEYDKYFSVLYIALIPTLNPFIYSLQNKEVKRAFWKLCNKVHHGSKMFIMH
ncbi:olfactory receptor 5B21-like [Leptodactylus fuscus]|uniref:olfactory receptor 5B21-like n=1 Tax=Leptodactylus fuscus TaxID=238119 RepID=UPI003F4EBB9C